MANFGGLAGAGAGAASAIKDITQQRLLRDQLEELTRSNVAGEGLASDRNDTNRIIADAQRRNADVNSRRQDAAGQQAAADAEQQAAIEQTRQAFLASLEEAGVGAEFIREANARFLDITLDSDELRTPAERDADDARSVSLSSARASGEANARADVADERRRPSFNFQTIGGNRVAVNEETLEQTELGPVTPTGGASASGRAGALEAALPVVDLLEELSVEINTATGPTATVRGLGKQARAAVNLDPTASRYQSVLKGFIPLFARAVGHVGILTQQDVDSVRGLFPTLGTSQEIAEANFRDIRRLIAEMNDGTVGLAEIFPSFRPGGKNAGPSDDASTDTSTPVLFGALSAARKRAR